MGFQTERIHPVASTMEGKGPLLSDIIMAFQTLETKVPT